MKTRKEDVELYLSKLRCQEDDLTCKLNDKNVHDASDIIKRLDKCKALIKKFETERESLDSSGGGSSDNNQDTLNYTAKNNAYLKVRRLYPILNI